MTSYGFIGCLGLQAFLNKQVMSKPSKLTLEFICLFGMASRQPMFSGVFTSHACTVRKF